MNLRIPVPYQILESVKAVALELCRVQTDSARQEIPHVLYTAPSHSSALFGQIPFWVGQRYWQYLCF